MEKNIEKTALYLVLATLLFLAIVTSTAAGWRVEELNKKIQTRDSIIIRMEQHQEQQDSIMFEYVDKWIDRIVKANKMIYDK